MARPAQAPSAVGSPHIAPNRSERTKARWARSAGRAPKRLPGMSRDVGARPFRPIHSARESRQPAASCVRCDRDAINIGEVVVVFTKPDVVWTLVVGARPQPDEKGSKSIVNSCDSKVGGVIRKPVYFLDRDAVDRGHNFFIETEDFVKILCCDVTNDVIHRRSLNLKSVTNVGCRSCPRCMMCDGTSGRKFRRPRGRVKPAMKINLTPLKGDAWPQFGGN